MSLASIPPGIDAAAPGAKYLLEVANGTSSYTLVRGFGPEPDVACAAYNRLLCGPNQKKRLTHVLNGERTVVARSK